MSRRRSPGTSIVAGVLAAGALSSAPPVAATTEPAPAETLSLSYAIPVAAPGLDGAVAIFAVGEQYGFFDDEGIDVDLQFIADGTAVQAVATGDLDATAADATNVAVANGAGTDLRVISSYVMNSTWTFAVLPDSEARSISDLAGATIGISSLASSANPATRAMLSLSDVDPDTVQYVATGGGASMVEALAAGQIDAMVNFTNPLRAFEQAGYELRYLDSPELTREPVAGVAITTSASALGDDERSEALTRFLRAAYRGLTFSFLNPEAAVLAGWEMFPTLITDGADPTEEFAADVATFELWLETVLHPDLTGYTDAASLGEWGHIDDRRWEVSSELGILGGTLTEPIDVGGVYDPSLLEAANEFDRAAVDELASAAPTAP